MHLVEYYANKNISEEYVMTYRKSYHTMFCENRIQNYIIQMFSKKCIFKCIERRLEIH